MGCELEACGDCRRRCVLIHGKIDNELDTALTSFFKVMIGDEFSTVLLLPPKFARTVSALVDQKIDLEDSIGQRWEVTLSNLNGYLAFQEGWHEFSLGHGLEIGDFVAFHHIKGSHFVVQIYTRSGCENLDFPWEKSNCKKRKKCSGDFVVKDGSCHTVDKFSIDKQGSNSSAASRSNVAIEKSCCNVNNGEEIPISKQNTSNCENSNPRPQAMAYANVEELFCMVDRDLGYKGESRDTLLDLSNFEMCKNKACSGRDEKAAIDNVRLHRADVLLKSQTEADLIGNGSVAEEVVGRVVPSETSDVEMLEQNNRSEVADNTLGSNKDICNGTDSRNLLTPSVAKPNAPLETPNIEMLERNNRSEVADNTLRSNEDTCSGTDSRNPLAASVAKPNMPLNTSNVEMLERNSRSEVVDNTIRSNKDVRNGSDSRNLLTASVVKPRIDGNDSQEVSNKKLKTVENLSNVQAGTDELVMPQKEPTPISSCQPIKCKTIQIPGIRDFPVAFQMQKLQSGKGSNISVGKGDEIVNLPVKNNNNEAAKIVKTEPVEPFSSASPSAVNISCLVQKDDRSILELPTCLPPHPCEGRIKMHRRIVLLKDPVMRLWPVLYHSRYSFKILGKGWASFRKGNDIRPGDECVFCIETETKDRGEPIYRVQVNRKAK